jgi:isopentenyl-diphosphate delta-isomerase type 1
MVFSDFGYHEWTRMNGNVKAATAGDWFDVVDDRDEVIGRERRAVVHARALRHRAVHVFVFNAAGQTFLQKRAQSKDTSPGLWTVACSGHVDAGEDYDTAARRELGEELGLPRCEAPARWFRLTAGKITGWEFCWVYQLEHEGPFTLQAEEIDDGEWLTVTDLKRRLARTPEIFCPAFRWIWSLAEPRIAAK